jgi:hypothetical protein
MTGFVTSGRACGVGGAAKRAADREADKARTGHNRIACQQSEDEEPE